jgi:hypothetical protein
MAIVFKKVLLLWEQRLLTLQFEEQTGTEFFYGFIAFQC